MAVFAAPRRASFQVCNFYLLFTVALLLSTASTLRASTVTATWNANPESDIAGYKLSYGTASGVYTTTIDVGNVTSYVVTLAAGQTYYFVLQAYDTSGLASAMSAEVSYTVPTSSAPTIVSLTPAAGAVGAAVTISGTNFGATKGTSTVTFNGTGATPTSWTATSLVVPVPAGATTGNVVVTVGGVASNALPFTVTAAPLITFVQQNSAVPSAATTVGVPFPLAQTAGNLNVVVVGWDDVLSTVQSVGDTNGNVYMLAVGPTVLAGTATQAIYYAKNITGAAAGANTVTVTFSGAAVFPDVRVAEYSGLDPATPLDVAGGASGTSSTSSSGAVTTTNVNDLLVGANYTLGTTSGPGAGYTARVITTPDTDILEDEVVTASGSYSATASLSSAAGWIMQLVAFRATAGVSPVAPTLTSLTPPSGPVGMPVTIAGANFGGTRGTSTVTFNGTAATPTNWSTTSIVVPVPAGATTGNVVVTVGGLASNTLPYTVTVPPSLTSLAPPSGPVGTPVTITGANFGGTRGASTVTFNGAAATPTTWSTTSIVVPVPTGATTGSVAVTVGGLASNALPFTVTVAPSLTSLSPATGAVGTAVTISGTNFGATKGTSTVTFNGTGATPTSWTATSLVVPVPAGATTGNVVVTVGGLVSNALPFTVTAAPPITFVQQNSAVPSAATTVGVPFPLAQTAGNLNVVVVGWDDVVRTVQSVGDTNGNVYTVAVGPTVLAGTATQAIYYAKNITGAAAGANTVTVTFSGAAVFPDVRVAEYSGLDPATPLDVAGGASGTSSTSSSGAVTTTNVNDLLVGANYTLGTTSGPGAGYTARVITTPDTDILEDEVVTASGSYSATASLSSAAGWIMQLVAFRATAGVSPVAPTLTSLTPPSGPVGMPVTIAGANFGGTQGTSTVTFNGTAATPTNWSTTSIVVPVPAGATTGNVVVTVGGLASNTLPYTVTVPPSLTSLAPPSGPVGTPVTITGANFGGTRGASTVTFNGAAATPTTWSTTSIVVPVPTGATTGSVAVTVGGLASNALPFTVTVAPSLTSLSPATGAVGTAVTISGTNFGATKGTSTVTFNGTGATPTSWTATSLVVPVPAGATTGNVVVTVGGLASNALPFTVTAAPPITFVQQNSAVPSAATTVGVPFPLAQTAGNLNVVVVGWDDVVRTVQSVGDTNGNVYTVAVGPTVLAGTATQAIYYAKNITGAAAGANTVTVTFSGAAVFPDVRVAEYSGLDPATPLDVAGGASGTSSTSSSGAVTTTNVNDLLVGANYTLGTTSGPGAGYTARVITTPDTDILEDEVVTASGSYSATASLSSAAGWIMQLVAFRATAGVSPVAPTLTSLTPPSGPVGMPVTIAGANFGGTQGTSTVTFNGTAATPTNWSTTSIVVPVPAGATTGNVVVTVGGLASNTLPYTVTVPPSLTSLAPPSGPVGTAVTITGTNFGATKGTSTVTFNGAAATPTTWSTTSIVVPVPTGATTGSVAVTVGGLASNALPFTVTVAPSLTSLSPATGAVGTAVTISGTNFGATKGTSTVTFNGTGATPTSWTATSLVVPVPAGATTGNVVVTVGGLVSNALPFTVTAAPPITFVQQNSAVPSAATTVGVPFPLAQTAGNLNVVVVGWDDVVRTVQSVGDTNGNVYTVAVGPTVLAGTATQAIYYAKNITGAAAGANTVTVTFSGAAVFPDVRVAEYSGLDPATPLDVAGGASGTSSTSSSGAVTTTNVNDLLVGANYTLGTTSGPGAGYTARVITTPDTDILEDEVVTASGSYSATASLSSAAGWIMQLVAFRATAGVSPVAPTLTSLTPPSGPVGMPVTIAGANFGGTQGTSTVTFNGTAATPTNWSTTSIVVPVPAGATTGNVVVTVGGLASNTLPYTVTVPPSLTSLAPPSGPVGTPVTITGANFGGTRGASTVTFNGAAATPTTWSTTSIVVPVPTGATTGSVAVTVGGLASNALPFTVTVAPSLTSLSPATGAVGTAVTISGTNFGATKGTSTVTFNGTGATPTSWTATSLVVPVPAGATTGNVVVTVGGLASNALPFTVTAAPPITFVQQNSAVPSAATTVGVPFPLAQTAGNLNVVVVGWDDVVRTVQSVGDTNGNVYTVAVGPTVLAGTATQAIYYAKNITGAAAGANTVTVTFSGAAVFPDVRVAEYSGLDPATPLDVAGGASGTSSTSSSGAVTTTNVNDLLVGANYTLGTTSGPGAGYTARVITTPDTDILEDEVVTAIGSYSATAPLSSAAGWIMQLVAFRATAGVSPVAPTLTSLTPPSGPVGMPVTIAGANFGGTQGTSTVTFNGTAAAPTSWSATSLVVPVPPGATTGNVVVTANGLASNTLPYTVTVPPSLTSLAPTSGPVGTAVTITGTNFGATKGTSTVTFNGTAATPTTWSTTSIVVPVPTGATTGSVVVTVGGLASNGVTYTVNLLRTRNDAMRAIDFDGDGKADLGMYRPSTGGWSILKSSTNYTTSVTATLGVSTDRLVPGDYDGDGKADVAIYRPSTGTWQILLSSTNYTTSLNISFGLSTDIPVPGDYDGDGKTDIAVYRPSNGGWYILKSSTNFTTSMGIWLGLAQDIPVPGDYDGDGQTDVAVYRPSTGMWYVRGSSTNYVTTVSYAWGISTDIPVPGDYDGDGKIDPAVYRAATGTWYILLSSTGYTTHAGYSTGVSSTDIPVPADYDGDGLTDVAVYHPTSGTWSVLKSSNGFAASPPVTFGSSLDVPLSTLIATTASRPAPTDATRASDYDGDGKADIAVYRPPTGTWSILTSSTGYTSRLGVSLGTSTDIPVPGDYDGDKKTDAAVFTPSTGTWSILKSSTNYTTGFTVTLGAASDIPVPGDYDGDGKTDVAVFHAATGTWAILKSSTNYATSLSVTLGVPGDIPVPGDYDGDGKTDIAVYRPSSGIWYILQSSTNYATMVAYAWGISSDIPVPGDYDGDGKTDIAVYRQSSGTWYILQSSSGYTTYVGYSSGISATDIPVPSDYDGDGQTDIAVYHPGSGTWSILLSSTGYTSVLGISGGLSTDAPLPVVP